MINKLFRKYNQNRMTIWAVIIFVTFFIILLRVFMSMSSKSNTQINNQLQTNNINTSQNTNNGKNNIAQNNTSNSIISSSNISNNKAEKIIGEFVNYCNKAEITKAYEMLTKDCKQVLFPSIQEFQANYIQKVFSQPKTAKVEQSMYGSNIYKVNYYHDNLLANGGYSQEATLQDHMVVLQEEGKSKLSLNKFIGIKAIAKAVNTNQIYIKAIQKQAYIDYETYQVQITNNTTNTILIADKQNSNQVCIIDEKEVEYPSNIAEQNIESLELKPNETTILNITFSKMYNVQRNIKTIRFSNIITNYEQYKQGEEPNKINILISI